jgi:hypothetical protein
MEHGNFDLLDLAAGTVILSVVENRSREICVSKMNSKNTGQVHDISERLFSSPFEFIVIPCRVLEVFLVCDNHSYVELLSLIEDCGELCLLIIINEHCNNDNFSSGPHEILIHDGQRCVLSCRQ